MNWLRSGGDSVSSHEVHHDGDDREHDENVNDARRDMKRKQTQGPENEQGDSDRQQHGTLLLASGVPRDSTLACTWCPMDRRILILSLAPEKVQSFVSLEFGLANDRAVAVKPLESG
jgi:hypothetical protein